MDLILFSILTILSLILLVLGLFKKQTLFILFAGIIFIILGLFSWNGLVYKSGESVTNNYICTICNNPATNITNCTGTPTPCIDHASIGICDLYGGCSWNGTDCIGTPTECSAYNRDLTSCELNGCNITNTYTAGTPGINASVVGSYNVNYVYSLWNDNIGTTGLKFTTTFGAILILIGLLLMFVSAVSLFTEKTADITDSDDE